MRKQKQKPSTPTAPSIRQSYVYGIDGPMPAHLFEKVKAYREAGKFNILTKKGLSNARR
jgi:hypothetical protein